MPEITIIPYGKFKELIKIKKMRFDKNEILISELLATLGLKEEADLWILINGSRADSDAIIVDGDQVSFFQPVGGG